MRKRRDKERKRRKQHISFKPWLPSPQLFLELWEGIEFSQHFICFYDFILSSFLSPLLPGSSSTRREEKPLKMFASSQNYNMRLNFIKYNISSFILWVERKIKGCLGLKYGYAVYVYMF